MTTTVGEELVGAVVQRRWRLVRVVGSGAIGTVYEGADLRGGPSRALKLLHREHAVRPELADRFVTEALAMAKLRHRNIVPAEESGRAEDGSPYYVMPLLVGHSLGDALRRHARIDVDRAARLAYAALSGLAYAHAHGVVHRDVKPDNVFVARMPTGRYSAVLLDFGVAKIIEESERLGSRTVTGALIGTPAYMSPEQIQDAKRVDHRTDLWSVGVLLYELLTGVLPFRTERGGNVLYAVLTASPTPVDEHVAELARWRGFFERALARDADRRFGSADEMRAMVMDLVDAPPSTVADAEGATRPARLAALLPTEPSIAPEMLDAALATVRGRA